MLLQNINHQNQSIRIDFQRKQSQLNIEKWVILSSSHSPLTELLPLSILSFFSLFRTYANTTRHERKVKTQVYKKECSGLDRPNPLKSFFCPSQTEFSSDTAPDPIWNLGFFPSPTDKSKAFCPNLKYSNSPLFLGYCRRLWGTVLRQGKGNPWGCGLPCQRPSEIQSIRIDCL